MKDCQAFSTVTTIATIIATYMKAKRRKMNEYVPILASRSAAWKSWQSIAKLLEMSVELVGERSEPHTLQFFRVICRYVGL